MRTLLVLGILGTLAVPSSAQPKGDIGKRVDAHLTRGIGFYAQKQFELAIIEFRAGFALDPRPDFLFALAQAERLSGDCPSAVVYYKRFLKTKPGTNQAEAARVNMRRCTRALESGPPGKTAKPQPASARAKVAAATPAAPLPRPGPLAISKDAPEPTDRRWYRDRVAVSLVAGAGVSLIVGGGFWFAKASAESAAESAADDAQYRDDIARARRNRSISLVGIGLSAALGAAATYRLVSRSREHRRSAVLVASPEVGGASIGVVGRF